MAEFLNKGQRARLVDDLREAQTIAAEVCGYRGDNPRANASSMAAVFTEIRQMRRELQAKLDRGEPT